MQYRAIVPKGFVFVPISTCSLNPALSPIVLTADSYLIFFPFFHFTSTVQNTDALTTIIKNEMYSYHHPVLLVIPLWKEICSSSLGFSCGIWKAGISVHGILTEGTAVKLWLEQQQYTYTIHIFQFVTCTFIKIHQVLLQYSLTLALFSHYSVSK